MHLLRLPQRCRCFRLALTASTSWQPLLIAQQIEVNAQCCTLLDSFACKHKQSKVRDASMLPHIWWASRCDSGLPVTDGESGPGLAHLQGAEGMRHRACRLPTHWCLDGSKGADWHQPLRPPWAASLLRGTQACCMLCPQDCQVTLEETTGQCSNVAFCPAMLFPWPTCVQCVNNAGT